MSTIALVDRSVRLGGIFSWWNRTSCVLRELVTRVQRERSLRGWRDEDEFHPEKQVKPSLNRRQGREWLEENPPGAHSGGLSPGAFSEPGGPCEARSSWRSWKRACFGGGPATFLGRHGTILNIRTAETGDPAPSPGAKFLILLSSKWDWRFWFRAEMAGRDQPLGRPVEHGRAKTRNTRKATGDLPAPVGLQGRRERAAGSEAV